MLKERVFLEKNKKTVKKRWIKKRYWQINKINHTKWKIRL